MYSRASLSGLRPNADCDFVLGTNSVRFLRSLPHYSLPSKHVDLIMRVEVNTVKHEIGVCSLVKTLKRPSLPMMSWRYSKSHSKEPGPLCVHFLIFVFN